MEKEVIVDLRDHFPLRGGVTEIMGCPDNLLSGPPSLNYAIKKPPALKNQGIMGGKLSNAISGY
ncbi:MAG: hypothetical protein JRI22_18835 [Deltaproteobacteria bacterium]|nr:hypothetical protein [Deltaproteobacteria bacterium]